MTATAVQFAALKESADPAVVDAIAALVHDGADHELNRVNVLDFSRHHHLDEERVISGFIHAARVGLFDLTWNVLCPGCGGVLDAHGTLKSLRSEDYQCGLCGCGYEATVDQQVEAAFTVSPRVRRIAAHDPNALPVWDYFKQVFWSSGVDFDEQSMAELSRDVVIDSHELPAGEHIAVQMALPSQFIIVFEPVTHAAHFIDVQGEPTSEMQHLALRYEGRRVAVETSVLRPGPLQIAFDNKAGIRVLPTVMVAADALHHLIGRRKPFLTAKRMLSNQTFRDVFKADYLNIDQRLKITSLTFLFTDLKSSTALYERVGDLVAFDMVRAHFRALLDIINAEKGAVVKTIGDAVMATFIKPEQALQAGLKMRDAMKELNAAHGSEELVVKIGIHEGPCLAVMLNDRQDYFGQTVNIAARVQSLSTAQEIHLTAPVIESPGVAEILAKAHITPIQKHAALRGIADKMMVYEIP